MKSILTHADCHLKKNAHVFRYHRFNEWRKQRKSCELKARYTARHFPKEIRRSYYENVKKNNNNLSKPDYNIKKYIN